MPHHHPALRAAQVLLLSAIAVGTLQAQTQSCEPVADRAGRAFGCFITARQELGPLPRDTALYWYIDESDSAARGTRALPPRSLMVTSLGREWQMTIAGAGLPAQGRRRLAQIGPLPLVAADSFAAVYMEGVFRPGMESPVHRHPGVEAWYTLDGEQCLETPEGKQVQRAGDPGVMVAGGLPMQLTGAGTLTRRSLVLILQDATQPRSTHAHDWTPRGLCRP